MFFRRPNGNFFSSICIFLSPAACALLSGNLPSTKFPVCLSCILPQWASLTSPTLQKMQMPKPVPLKCCHCTLCQSVLAQVLLMLLFSALKRQKVPNFPRAEPNPLEMDRFILNPKIAVRPPEKHFLLQ